MGTAAPVTISRDEIYESYRRGDYQNIYKEQCGESDTYLDPSIDENFRKFIPTAPKTAGDTIFKDFLNGGRNCHESTPAKRAITLIDAIKSLKDTLKQYRTWRQYFDAFVYYMARLAPHAAAADERRRTAQQQQTIITGLVESFEPYAKKMDEGINRRGFQSALAGPLRAIVEVQLAATRALRSAALALRLDLNPAGKRDSSFFLLMCERFLDSLVDFDDPFLWVKNNYAKLEWIQRQHFHDESIQAEVQVAVSDEHPVLMLEDANTLRDFIDYVVFVSAMTGTREDPVKLDFSWDGDLGAMIIKTDSLDGLKTNEAWIEISGRLNLLGGRIEGNRIVVPLQTVSGIAGPGETGGPEIPEDDLDDTTEIKAAMEDFNPIIMAELPITHFERTGIEETNFEDTYPAEIELLPLCSPGITAPYEFAAFL